MSPRRVSSWFAALVVAATAGLAPAGAAQAAARPDNYIFNNSNVGVGVWHDDGDPIYNAVLPAYKNTWDEYGWDHASRYYIGRGYCVRTFRRAAGTGGAWSFWDSFRGPDSRATSFAYDYQLQVHRLPSTLC
ncbi:hypothetical protein Aab01nite_53390 [Paractinoplanes abujensis]|uniref:Uncharacterized protein n=1 Tax=Paractinoplanes abujensis TaxID=882441 RepID=A0A7W7G2B5_9ACTN|nr:hypothetical protein [Actinoplanes abujensis]MBB4693592.1 hypothetical protein [Actinoplanes abujensis]GID21749.1 hypothetical protein Aab01nite_53390 [Actinoplanes abujensis]